MSGSRQIPALTIVPAGAGSGKTYRIQTTLSGWIREGLVDPAKIVAVTFTKSAAAEMRGRIRAELLVGSAGTGMPEEAIRLDGAYITTIHGFGQRLITEFAFDAGMSPSPRLLSEDEEKMLIRRALATSEAAAAIMQDLNGHGFTSSYGANGFTEAEEQFREAMLGLIARIRSIGRDGDISGLADYTRRRINKLYGETADGAGLESALSAQVGALLKSFPEDMAPHTTAETAKKELTKNYRDLKRAAETDALSKEWTLWKRLSALKIWQRQNPLPEGYNEKAEAVMAAALQLSRHPGPREDAAAQAERFLTAAAESLESYAAGKRERGLVDYTDMVAESRRLLAGNATVLEALRSRVDCLVIDEFQDTNPLQFSLLWTLAAAGVPALVVGDVKQAIMGFQGSDSRLLSKLSEYNRDAKKALKCNYRSSKELMAWINQVAKGLFSNYEALEPKAEFESRLVPVEVINATENLKPPAWASHVVARITALMDDPTQMVSDPVTKTHRRLRGGDFAIIARSNDRLRPYADALHASGIRSLLQEQGWLESREVQLAWHALAYVADRGDRHAALYLAVTELGRSSLKDALAAFAAGSPIEEPLLERLDGIAMATPDRDVPAVLEALIAELDLYGMVSAWPKARQARANLLRLQEEARLFVESNREAMASGGYYGSGIKTFQAWLKGRAQRDDAQPPEVAVDDDAVQLMTWHKAKGREWPVVAVCGLDIGIRHSLPYEGVVYEEFSDLTRLLDTAKIELLPAVDSDVTAGRFLDSFDWEREQDARSLLYVALTRAREKVILEWPASKGKRDLKKEPYWGMLVRACKMELTKDEKDKDKYVMSVAGTEFPCSTTNVRGKEPLEPVKREPQEILHAFGRACIETDEPGPAELTPEYLSPSSLHGNETGDGVAWTDVSYGSPLEIDFRGIDDPLMKGTMLHRAFELLCGHPERKTLLPAALGTALGAGQEEDLSRAAAAFDAWLQETWPGCTTENEVPLLALDGNGSVVSGIADMVVETSDGLWIIDHKSDRLPTPEVKEERLRLYRPQLEAYAEALGKARGDKPLMGMVINWLGLGSVSLFAQR